MRARTRQAARRFVSAALAIVFGLTTVLGNVSPQVAWAASGDSATGAAGSPQALSASVSASPTISRELADKRTPTSDSYLMSNGNVRVQYFADPVNFRDPATRRLVPIDSSLEETSIAGRLVSANAANTFRLQLPKRLSGDWVSIEASGAKVSLRPAARQRSGAAIVASEPVTSRSVSATDRAYPDAFRGADLSYESRDDGVKETIVVPRPTSSTVYGFDLGLSGATPRLEADGSVSITRSGDASPTFSIPAPAMWDATNENDGYSTAVHYELTGASSPYRLDVVCDGAWLTDPARVYPVTIDPSVVTYSITGTGASTTPADTYISGKDATNKAKNFCTSTLVWLNRTDPNANWTEYGYIHPGTSLVADLATRKAAGYEVVESRLFQSVYSITRSGRYQGQMCDPAKNVDIGGITYNTWLSGDPSVASGNRTPYVTAALGWNELDVTSMVQYWQDNSVPSDKCCTALIPENTSSHAHFSFYSCDGTGSKPYWQVDYAPIPTVSLSTPSAGPVTSVPDASWTYSEALGNPQVEYQIDVATSTAGAAVATTDVPTAATTSPLPVPSGGWVTGHRYYAHVRAASSPSAQVPRVWSDWSEWGDFTPSVPATITSVSATTTASVGWWQQSAGNDDSATAGRGAASLTWAPAAGATGYDIYLSDGAAYRKVGSTTATGWSSAGKAIYPSDSVIASRSVGATSNPFPATGGLDLRDDPRALYAKTAPNTVATLAYSFRVAPYGACGSTTPTENAECLVALENRTTHVNDDPRHTSFDLGSLFGDTASFQLDKSALTLDVTDLSLPSIGITASLSRHYSSETTTATTFAPGWRFDFEQSVTASGSIATYIDAVGEKHVFTQNGLGWDSPNGDTDRIEGSVSAGFSVTRKDRSKLTFGSNGRLSSIETKNNFDGPSRDMHDIVHYYWSYYPSGAPSSVAIVAPGDYTVLGVLWAPRRIVVSFDETGHVYQADLLTPGAVGGVDFATRSVTYDSANASVTRFPNSSHPEQRVYAYGDDGRLSQVAVPGFQPSDFSKAAWNVWWGSSGATMTIANETGAGTPEIRRDFEWDRAARVATTTLAGAAQLITWNANGTVASATNEGTTTALTRYSYDSAMNPIRRVGPSGGVTSASYDDRGNVLCSTDELGRVTRNVFSGDLLTQTTDPKGSTTWFTYDTRGNALTREQQLDASGTRSHTEWIYDPYDAHVQKQLTAITSTQTAEIDYGTPTNFGLTYYNVCGSPETVTNAGVKLSAASSPQDLAAHATYDTFGERLTVTDPMNVTTTRSEYDPASGVLLSTTDATNTVTHYAYDLLGNAVETSRTNGATDTAVGWKRATYNGAGEPVTETVLASDGSVVSTTVHRYDAAGREVTVTASDVPGADVTSYTADGLISAYWEAGAESSNNTTASQASATRITYNAEGEETSQTDPGSVQAANTTQLNPDGTVKSEAASDGTTSTYTYDASGDLLAESDSTDAGSTTSTYTTDLVGNVIGEADSDGSQATNTFDLVGNPVTAGSAGQNPSGVTRNTLGAVLTQTDFDGVITGLTYDSDGRVTQSSVGGLVTSTQYDSLGSVVSVQNPDGSSVAYEYDVFGRLVREYQLATDGNPVRDVRTTYDSAGRPLCAVDLIGGNQQDYAYSEAGTTTVTSSRNHGSASAVGTVSGTGLLSSVEATFAGARLDWSVVTTDSAGRVVDATSTTLYNDWRLTYDEAGHAVYGGSTLATSPSGEHSGTGLTLSLCKIACIPSHPVQPAITDSSTPAGRTYTYSKASGKKVGDSLQFGFGRRTEQNTYSYDVSGRLATATVSSIPTTYTYSASSSATQVAGAPRAYQHGSDATVTFSYANGRLTSAGGRQYGNDALGRRISERPSTGATDTTYAWTGDRLSGMSGPRGSGAYVYDAAGQRVRSVVTSGSLVTTTTYDYLGTTLQGLSASRSDGTTYSVDYLYDNTGVVFAGVYRAKDTTAVPFMMVTTDRGDVRELLDSSGASFAFYSYDAYGNPVETTSTPTTLVASSTVAACIAARQPLRYASYAYDVESNLYYVSQRYYDPATLQFISRDPKKSDGEGSLYQYCGSDPVNLVDPDGTEPHGYNAADGYGSSGYSHGYNKQTHSSMRDANDYARDLIAARRARYAWQRLQAWLRARRQRLDAERLERNRKNAQRIARKKAALRREQQEKKRRELAALTAQMNAWNALSSVASGAATAAPWVAAGMIALGTAGLSAEAIGGGDEIAAGVEELESGIMDAVSETASEVSNCFVRGTPVLTSAGLVTIDSIRPGALVLSRDERTGATSLKRVTRTMVHRASELVHVRTAENTVTATPNHPFRVAGRGWVAAGELVPGDTLYLADGGRASIVSVTREKLASPVDVYNLEVEDFHTYFVASTGVWVHNCGGESEAAAAGRAAHASFDPGPGFQLNKGVLRDAAGRLLRPDAFRIDGDEGLILELKPNNPQAIAAGARQVSRYLSAAEATYPHINWSGQVVTY